MSNHVNTHAIRHALEAVEKLPPLKKQKDPVVAAICGACGGGVGLGLFFESWLDFWMPWLALIVLGIVAIPTGEALMVLAPVLWAIYGYRRAKSSNEKLEGGDDRIIEAEIVNDAAPTQRTPIPTKRAGFITMGRSQPADQTAVIRLNKIKLLLQKRLINPAEYEAKRLKILSEL